VKVTVIATGFQRENLPVIHRRTTGSYVPTSHVPQPAPVAAAPMSTTSWPSEIEPEYEEPVMETEDAEEIYAEEEALLASVAPVEIPEEAPRAMAAAANAQPLAVVNGHSEPVFDELEVPAILRRDRRFLH
jgi:hypothetical protein